MLTCTYLFESCLPMVFSNPTSPESLDLFGINCVQIGISHVTFYWLFFCLNFLGMPPGAAGYPPNSSYGGYPPPPHNRPDAGPYPGSGGGYPPSSYPPAQRPGWPPHQGYGPPPTNGGPPPPNNAPPPGADYRQGYYGPRPGGPGYPPGGPQSGPPQASAGASPATSTASSGGPPNAPGGPPPNQNLYGQQPPYHDQYQVCENWKTNPPCRPWTSFVSMVVTFSVSVCCVLPYIFFAFFTYYLSLM